jgi:hypothetical protein
MEKNLSASLPVRRPSPSWIAQPRQECHRGKKSAPTICKILGEFDSGVADRTVVSEGEPFEVGLALLLEGPFLGRRVRSHLFSPSRSPSPAGGEGGERERERVEGE